MHLWTYETLYTIIVTQSGLIFLLALSTGIFFLREPEISQHHTNRCNLLGTFCAWRDAHALETGMSNKSGERGGWQAQGVRARAEFWRSHIGDGCAWVAKSGRCVTAAAAPHRSARSICQLNSGERAPSCHLEMRAYRAQPSKLAISVRAWARNNQPECAAN